VLEAIEAHYRRSVFIKEIGVFARESADAAGDLKLCAVVVPNLERLRERRIVNIGDLLRFEMEGLTADLPPESRVAQYDIWFEPLPRTAAGTLARDEIQRCALALEAKRNGDRSMSAADREWLADPRVAVALAVVRARCPVPHAVAPDANLEIDLGFDSLARIELVADLERRVGRLVNREALHEIFTVRQLVEAVEADAGRARAETAESVWTTLLNAPPADTDLLLGPLLRRKGLLAPLVFVMSRVSRCFVRLQASGLEHLPRAGVFIIAPNHQGYLDPFFVCSVLPYRIFRRLFFLGATEYFETPLTRWLAGALNIVPVDPDANLVGAMQAGAFGLTHDKILMVFPEGERSIDGRVKRFKKGATILSAHLGVPIVPVAINGSFEVWPRNRPIGWRRLGFWNRHRVRIGFGAPMQANPTVSHAESAQQLQETVEALWS
jgi:long-chain acyl-CoA synthetase